MLYGYRKYRRKAIYDLLHKYLGSTFRDLAIQKESQIMEGYLIADHVHVMMSIVGRDEEAIRKYIKEQKKEDRRIDQLNP